MEWMSDTGNLAVIPDAYDLTYGTGPQIIYLDYAETFNGQPSIRLERHVDGVDSNTGRECNTGGKTIQPGNHIIYSCYMKTTPSGLGDTNPYSGARIGIDFYSGSTRIAGWQSATFPDTDTGVRLNYVPWNTASWTKRTMEMTIPSTIAADAYSSFGAGTQVTPTAVILWLQVWSSSYGPTDPGLAWFAGAEFWVNPYEVTPSPTPTPTVTPTATPTPSPTPTPTPTYNPYTTPTPSPTYNPYATPTPTPTFNPYATSTPTQTPDFSVTPFRILGLSPILFMSIIMMVTGSFLVLSSFFISKRKY